MKRILIAIATVLGITASANAANFAEKVVSGSVNYEQGLKDLYAEEVQKASSPLYKYVTSIKNENPDYFIADKIEMEDIFVIESGQSGGVFEVNYLIVIRAGYKSNTFPMGYLKASIRASMDDESPYKITISKPAKVTIE
ncbi:hypothetical protein DOM22_04350 [Bdellovibrio sp. ZAP7]|uniref:hypothetical protein n=1 Tax=Bdellovibrio sp. ZAP7 TaxID=2231053 RepID=UPI001157F893|nr:hypothetical protein [Bdellovibrio sp. ZAP7]QDK44441.1 hypothetical protein DOM22_04350 [Bdellovibrio sp. ZAP7]